MTPREYKSLPKAEQQQVWHKLTNPEKRAIFEDDRSSDVPESKPGGAMQYAHQYLDYLRKHTCYGGVRGLVDAVFWLVVFGGLLGVLMVMNENVDALPKYAAWWIGNIVVCALVRGVVHAILDAVDATLERNVRER